MHDIRIRGHAFALRPITLADASLIVGFRSDPGQTAFLHPIPRNIEAQRDYLRRYFARVGDYYFVIDRATAPDAAAEGLVAIYNVDRGRGDAEWGRWVLRPGSLAATESAWLIFRVGFDLLGLDRVYCRTLAENVSVASFHEKAGMARINASPGSVEIGGEDRDVVEHELTRDRWPTTASLLEGRSRRLADRITTPR